MVFPMMMPFMGSGYYYSASNYDLCSTNPWNMMNMHFNQMFADSIAQTYLYNVPMYSFNNFYQYPSPGFDTFNSMLNPANYVQNCPMFRPTNPVGGGSGSGSVCDDVANEEARLKYNKLLSLMKAIEKVGGIDTKVKAEVNVAIRNTSGSYVDRYKALKTAYDKVDDNIVKRAITEKGESIGVSKEISNESDEDSFKNRLSKAGFEYTGTDMDTKVGKFKTSLDNIKTKEWKATDTTDIIKDIKEKGTILDFISSWNSTYSDNRIFDQISEALTSLEGEDAKIWTFENAKTSVITPLCDALIIKAEEVKDYAIGEDKEKIRNTIKKLKEQLNLTTSANKGNESAYDSLTDLFNNLYVYTRLAAMEKIKQEANSFYKDIDEEVFDKDNLFEKEVMSDLKGEGFDFEETETKTETKTGSGSGSETETKTTVNGSGFKETEVKVNSNEVDDTFFR